MEKHSQEILDQSVALNSLTKDLLQMKDRDNHRLFIALIVMILVNLAIVGGFLWYESQFVYETEKTVTTTTSEVDQDNGGFGGNHSVIDLK